MAVQKIHPSFQDVSALQPYRCDDIMQALEVRRCQLLENPPDASKPESKEAISYREAYLVIQGMKESGKEAIILNPGKDMASQILAQAREAVSDDTSLYYYFSDGYAGGINP